MGDIDKLYDRYHKARQQFDYYITGLTTAVLAYSVQTFDSGKYTNYVWLAPIAWLFLVLSIIAGLTRLEWINAILGAETEKFIKQNMYQNIRQNIPESLSNADKLQKICNNLPKELTPEGVEKWTKEYLDTCSKAIENINKHQSKAVKIAEWAYRGREWCFVIGLILLGTLKFLNF